MTNNWKTTSDWPNKRSDGTYTLPEYSNPSGYTLGFNDGYTDSDTESEPDGDESDYGRGKITFIF